MRIIRVRKPCEKCGNKMTDCKTDQNDSWGISECTNKKCDNWKDVPTLLNEGGKVEFL